MQRTTRNNVSATSSEKGNIQLVLAVSVPLGASEHYHAYIIVNVARGGADLTRAQSVTQHCLVGRRDL